MHQGIETVRTPDPMDRELPRVRGRDSNRCADAGHCPKRQRLLEFCELPAAHPPAARCQSGRCPPATDQFCHVASFDRPGRPLSWHRLPCLARIPYGTEWGPTMRRRTAWATALLWAALMALPA